MNSKGSIRKDCTESVYLQHSPWWHQLRLTPPLILLFFRRKAEGKPYRFGHWISLPAGRIPQAASRCERETLKGEQIENKEAPFSGPVIPRDLKDRLSELSA